MSKQQKGFKRKVVKYDRSFYVNVPAKLLKKNDPVIELNVIIDKMKKAAFVKEVKR